MGIHPVTHRPTTTNLNLLDALKLMQADAAQLVQLQLLQSLIQAVTSGSSPHMDSMSLFGSPSLGNNQANDLFSLNREIEGFLGGSLDLQDSVSAVPDLSGVGQYLSMDLQHVPESSFCKDGGGAEISNVPSAISFQSFRFYSICFSLSRDQDH
ncbi:unnamed protein product [Musa acuminata subsp. burmannicoides]|nr:unnamed protein product [Musa acuminata subsp. malaccensis]